MSEGLGVVIGMTIAYIASLMGLIFAWIHYKRHKAESNQNNEKI